MKDDVDRLFLETVRDLRSRTDLAASEYDLRQAAGLIRRLCLDKEYPLIDLVLEAHPLVLTCEWGRLRVATPAANGLTWVPMLWLDPLLYQLQNQRHPELATRAHELAPHTGPLEEFLKTDLLIRDGSSTTPAAIVSDYANRRGGVHYDPRDPRDPLLSDVRAKSSRSLDLTMLAIGRIVYQAIEPLAARVFVSREVHPFGFKD
ncbi:MAG: hypothetical protein ACOYEV_10390 [Candidatus Nanopelagicales bacterium]